MAVSRNVVGKSIIRGEGPDKVSGKALFTADVARPRMIWGKVLRSPFPSAKILGIDTSQAEAAPGVYGVVTAKDLPDSRVGRLLRDMPVLARDRVRFVGEKVAAVAAETLEAAEEALLLLDTRQAPSGLMPVILGPAQSGILLHEAVGHPLEADFNRKGTSAYSGRLGEKVAAECCTIYDSGAIAHDRGALNCDDEGVPAQENLLIENGILRGYMHDRISAKHYGVGASGNGRRESYAHYPMPRMTTTFLANGESDPEEIRSAVKRGVYCESFSGGQVDISNGDFVFVPTVAWLVEDGRKTAPIKNFTLIGNGPDAMSKVSMVGNDFAMSEGIWTCGKDGQSVPVGVGLPTVLISEMTVGGISE